MKSESLFKKCTGCERLISPSANVCPHCGHKNGKFKKAKIVGFIFIGLALLVNVGKNKENIDSPPPPQPQTSSAINIALPENPSYSKDRWEQNIDVSKIDDSSVVTLMLPANNQINGWLMSAIPTLHIRCKENATELFIVTQTSANIEDIYDSHTVEIRLDKGNAFKQRWTASTDNNALFAPNAIDLSKKIAVAEKMVVRFTPFNANPQVIEFDVVGLNKHLKLVAKTCKWSYTNNKENQ